MATQVKRLYIGDASEGNGIPKECTEERSLARSKNDEEEELMTLEMGSNPEGKDLRDNPRPLGNSVASDAGENGVAPMNRDDEDTAGGCEGERDHDHDVFFDCDFDYIDVFRDRRASTVM